MQRDMKKKDRCITINLDVYEDEIWSKRRTMKDMLHLDWKHNRRNKIKPRKHLFFHKQSSYDVIINGMYYSLCVIEIVNDWVREWKGGI